MINNMAWKIYEHKSVAKICKVLPLAVLKKYELWKNLIFRHGPGILRQFPGFHDEKLKGSRQGQRSSRLNKQYRVIYTAKNEIVTVYVEEVTPHKY
jgi:toxin HigB-1